jgi:hypothetical protein
MFRIYSIDTSYIQMYEHKYKLSITDIKAIRLKAETIWLHQYSSWGGWAF